MSSKTIGYVSDNQIFIPAKNAIDANAKLHNLSLHGAAEAQWQINGIPHKAYEFDKKNWNAILQEIKTVVCVRDLKEVL